MSATAVNQIIHEDDISEEQIVADQAEIDPDEPIPPEVLEAIKEGITYFEAGGEGIPHEVVMAEFRANLARR